MNGIGTTIVKNVLPPALQKMANFMGCAIKHLEIFSVALENGVNSAALKTPRTDFFTMETAPRGMAQQLQTDIEGQKLIKYSEGFGKADGNGGKSNFTGIETRVVTQQISQALGLAKLGGKRVNSIFNTAPNVMQKINYMEKSMQNLVYAGWQGGKKEEITKEATGETNMQAWQVPAYFGKGWGEYTNKALVILPPAPYNLTKHQSQSTANLFNNATAVNKTKNHSMVAIAQRQGEISGTLSYPDISRAFSLSSVGNYKETIVGGSADTPMGTSTSDHGLKYIRDVAQRDAVNNYTTAQITVDFKNNATINSDLDIDLVMNKFTEKLREAVDTCAEGVNYCV